MNRMSFASIPSSEKLIAPSLLAADFACLKSDIEATQKAGVKILHIDVMDGHFVPNLSIGVPIVAGIRGISEQLFDVHLMITNPLQYINPFVKAGADHITFHVESEGDALEIIKEIRRNNVTVGISLKPKTSPELLLPYLELVDMVLVMTVEPGFGGQSFMSDMMDKIKFIRKKALELNNKNLHIQVDGGIDIKTIGTASRAGANIFVAGTSVFKFKDKIQSSAVSLLEEARNPHLG